MIDMHSHILPRIDDGAADWDQSLAMARAAGEDGIPATDGTPKISFVNGTSAPPLSPSPPAAPWEIKALLTSMQQTITEQGKRIDLLETKLSDNMEKIYRHLYNHDPEGSINPVKKSGGPG